VRILYVVHDYFPRFYGGTERYVLNVAVQMQRLGHAVKVLTYGLEDPVESFQTRENLLYKTYTYGQVPVISIRHRAIPWDVGHRIRDSETEATLAKIVKEESCDLVHVAHPMRLASVTKIARGLGIPVVLTLTDFWLLCPRGRMYKPDFSLCNNPEAGRKCARECGLDSSIYARYQEAEDLFRSADVLLAPSRFLIEFFKMNGWKRSIRLLKHGVDYRYVKHDRSTHNGRPGTVTFGFCGVVAKFKGVDLLVEAFTQVPSSNIRLKIYGNSVWEREYYDKIRNEVAGDNRIQLMGSYQHEDLPNIMNSIDVMVVPSSTLESYGLVLIESLAYDVPVVASNIVGSAMEYLRHGENGFVFDYSRPETLSGIIQMLSDHPETLEKLRGRIVLPPRIEEEVFELECVYQQLLSAKTGSDIYNFIS
jgi:glycosyltransferase involved in cell wall biosynthesis